MTVEFWPRKVRKPRPKRRPTPNRQRARRPKLPIGVGKAHQLLSSAIICGDHELASWVDMVVKDDGVCGTSEQLLELAQRLDTVMEPLPSRTPPIVPDPSPDVS